MNKKRGIERIVKIRLISWNDKRKHNPIGKNNPIKKIILNFDSIFLKYILNFLSNVLSLKSTNPDSLLKLEVNKSFIYLLKSSEGVRMFISTFSGSSPS